MIHKINSYVSSFKVVVPACILMSTSVLTYMITDNNKQIEKKKQLNNQKNV